MVWAAVLGSVGPASAQPAERPIALDEAVAEALRRNVEFGIAELERIGAEAGADRASAFLWPELTVSSGVVRSIDPVFAFGTKLRQGVFGEADLAIDPLNDPDPISDWTAGVDVRWNAVAPTRWAERSAAGRRAEAAGWAAVRVREATLLGTRELYFEAVRAEARLEAAVATESAARATLERFVRREERGLLTEADRLQAEAEFASARAARIDAARVAADARQALGSFLGWSPDTVPVPTDSLDVPVSVPAASFDPAGRADVRALTASLDERRARRRAASLAYVPTLDAFGSLRAHANDLFGDDGDDWTVGLALRWTAFAGFGRDADLDRARVGERIARLRVEHATREAAREVDAADRSVDAARGRVEATSVALHAAGTAASLMRRRFEEGLATPDELLQAEARLAEKRSGAVDALAAWNAAVARAEFARSRSSPEETP